MFLNNIFEFLFELKCTGKKGGKTTNQVFALFSPFILEILSYSVMIIKIYSQDKMK